jgi:hypothetical protein
MIKDEYTSNFSAFSFENATPCHGDCEQYFNKICCSYKNVLSTIISFLDLKELFHLKLTSKTIYDKIDSKILKHFIRSGSLTNKYRKSFWLSQIKYKEKEIIIKRENPKINNDENFFYKNLIDLVQLEISEDKSNMKRIYDEIGRDVDRTFHVGKFTTEEGQQELRRVLSAIAYIRPEIGYCQGMNFVAGALLYFLEKEDIVFWIFLSLLDDKNLNSLYLKVNYYKLEYARLFLENLSTKQFDKRARSRNLLSF